MKKSNILFNLTTALIWSNALLVAQNIDTIFHTGNSALSYNTVNTVITDNKNNIWVGTEYGLNRFNEMDWQVWFVENSNLPGDAIRTLTFDGEKNIWIGTTDSDHFAYYDKDSIQLFKKPETFKDFIRDLIFFENENDTLMAIATPSGLGLYSLSNQNWEIYDIYYPYLVSPHFTSIAYTNESGIYAGTVNGGLVNIENNGNISVVFGEETSLPDNTILDIEFDSTGKIWLATPEGGLTNYDGNKFEVFTPENSDMPSRSIACLAVESPQEIWCGTFDAGIIKFSTSGVTIFDTLNSPLLSNKINHLHIQNDSIMWAATDKGLARICLTDKVLSYNISSNTLYKNLVYPNPGNGLFNVKHSVHNSKIAVFNINGNIVYQNLQVPQQLKLNHLYSGTYLLSITTKQVNFIQKIIIL